jgi:hypothetical protein
MNHNGHIAMMVVLIVTVLGLQGSVIPIDAAFVVGVHPHRTSGRTYQDAITTVPFCGPLRKPTIPTTTR